MKIGVIGAGGREHAIIKKLKQNDRCEEIHAIPGNGGIGKDAVCVLINIENIDEIVKYAVKNKLDYVVVAPDDPLANGLVDALLHVGIPSFGPSKAAAKIEASKLFAKQLMERFAIPTASYADFTDAKQAFNYIRAQKVPYPVVIKADGLAFGKGVVICENEQQATKALHDMLEQKIFGESGARVVVEEFLTGPEVSVLAFCDGKTLVPMVSSMDHKRAMDGDTGANTGGMGAIAPNPFYTPEIAEKCMKTIFMPTLRGMETMGTPFKGCLYFGLMLTQEGPKVIEYNCRFGDPEAQVVLPLLESDLLTIMMACTNGTLRPEMVCFSEGAAACVVMASGGYPGKFETGYTIYGLNNTEKRVNTSVYHSGDSLCKDGFLKTTKGRVLGVTAVDCTLIKAIERAYQSVREIQFENAYFRNDIGQKAIFWKK